METKPPATPPELPNACGPCAECGRTFPPEDMVQLFGTWVCAGCKPVFVQRLREGAPVGGSARMWRDGKALVVMHQTEPPSRCAKCNGPVSRPPIKRTLYWHASWIYLLILLSLFIYIIVALIVRKKAVVLVPLCEEHRHKRAVAIAVSWSLVLLSFVCFGLAIGYEQGYVALLGAIIFFAGIVLGVWKGTLVSAKKIDDSYVWVRGYGSEFLKSLPEWINRG